MAKRFKHIYQFKISLDNAPVPIWRRIQVPDCYTFWDFHVAIQSAMGWLDEHLHHFFLKNPISKKKAYIEMESFEEDDDFFSIFPIRKQNEKYFEREQFIANWFTPRNKRGKYVYDFGDGWEHTIVLEDILPKEKKVQYPRCLAGKGLCPPENCGGVWGYKHLLEVIANPQHEEYQELCSWLEYQGLDPKDYLNPEKFDPSQVEFIDPEEHRREILEWEEIEE